MGKMGTLLFIPFMLLFIGFFVFLFYQIRKNTGPVTKQKDEGNKEDTHTKSKTPVEVQDKNRTEP
jgi:uncharacterized membrane protein